MGAELKEEYGDIVKEVIKGHIKYNDEVGEQFERVIKMRMATVIKEMDKVKAIGYLYGSCSRMGSKRL